MSDFFLGLKKARTVLMVEIIYNLVNAGLCIYLVRIEQAGSAGVAWASVIAEIVKFLILAALVARLPQLSVFATLRHAATWQLKPIWRLLKLNRDLFLRTTLLMLCLALFTRAGAKAGETELAANNILFQFFVLSALLLDGFESAAQTLCGTEVGARNHHAFRYVVRGCMIWGILFSLLIAFIYAVAGPWLIGLFTDVSAVRVMARSLAAWTIVMPLVGIVAFVFDGVCIGASWTRAMLGSMLLSFCVFGIILMVLVPILGMDGLWIGFLSLFAVRGLTQAMLYPRLTRQTFNVSSEKSHRRKS